MNVSIDPHFQRFIEDQVKAGRYGTPEEVVHCALAHLASQIDLAPDELDELKREIALGLEELDRGEVEEWDPEELWSEVERLHAKRARSKDKKAG